MKVNFTLLVKILFDHENKRASWIISYVGKIYYLIKTCTRTVRIHCFVRTHYYSSRRAILSLRKWLLACFSRITYCSFECTCIVSVPVRFDLCILRASRDFRDFLAAFLCALCCFVKLRFLHFRICQGSVRKVSLHFLQ